VRTRINTPNEALIESKIERIPWSGCWIWMGGCISAGYGAISINAVKTRAHRLSWEIFNGPAGELCVCHSCDIPQCVNPNHLFLGTQQDNSDDKIKKGRRRGGRLHGEQSWRAVLTEGQALEILRAKGNEKVEPLANRFNVTVHTVYAIWERRNWKHLEN
jgi:hypothetical protein